MSMDAITWALQQAPTTPTAKGKPAPSSCRSVLVALAYHADKHGKNAFPSVATIVDYTDLSPRCVQECLRRLTEVELIHPSARAEAVATKIPRADRRPTSYDLALHKRRPTNPNGANTAHPEKSSQPDNEAHQAHPEKGNEVHTPHPEDTNGTHTAHPASPNGVQITFQRGAHSAPEQDQEQDHKRKRAAARARAQRTTDLTELSKNAAKPKARSIVDQWRAEMDPDGHYRKSRIQELTKAADRLLGEGCDPDLVRQALNEFHRRADARHPSALNWLYDDAVKAAQGARNGGRPSREDKVNGWLNFDPDAPVESRPFSAREDKVDGWTRLAQEAQAAEAEAGRPELTSITGGMSA